MNNQDESPSLTRQELVSAWSRFYGSEPPKGLSRHTLELSLDHHKQSRKYGGLNTETLKYIHSLVTNNKQVPVLINQAKPGARLLREWQGQTYIVDILESGYLWQEKIYKSLSEIAREITGARWSGPRFFGLKS